MSFRRTLVEQLLIATAPGDDDVGPEP